MLTEINKLTEFDALRPRLQALMELYRAARTDEARAALMRFTEELFLAAAWNVANDLLDNGWSPSPSPSSAGARRLRVVGDAA
ncbi:MAG TPA: hypothetical protein VGL58_15480 [Caulobacteraceae bacterium]|jgi:hypothetical protein